jgi:two-component system, LuxR family, sensor kinase FixL
MRAKAHADRLRTVIFSRVLDANKIVVGIAYLAAYTLLDWLSLIEPYAQLTITPWNPGTGLSFVLLLVYGRRMIAFVVIAPLLADIVQRNLPLPWSSEIVASILIGAGYTAAALVMMRPRVGFDPALSSMRDLLLLLLVAFVSAALVAAGYVSLTVASGLLPAADFVAAAIRHWVGDVIGITVVTPFALFALTRRSMLPASREAWLQMLAIGAALAIVFGFADEEQFQLFYVLFLPIIWVAVRTGTEGVSVAILVTQLGLIAGIQFFPAGTFNVTSFQALMLVLAITGLITGEVVTEHRRTQSQLRRHQDSLSHLAKLGSMGELAAAVAHELNQPLMAAGTYTRLLEDTIQSGNANPTLVADTAKKAVAQVERAAEVVRRLRALVRLDRSNRAPCKVERIFKEAIDLCQGDIDRHNIATRIAIAPETPPVMIDLLQIEQVLINLVRNAVEAMEEHTTVRGVVTLEAKPAAGGFVEIVVSDTGPGFPPQMMDNAFLPLSSVKAEGLGIGLPLCKSIVEAHGGELTLESSAQGAVVRFTLPIATSNPQ